MSVFLLVKKIGSQKVTSLILWFFENWFVRRFETNNF
jgi:hypothetical protein